jgi:hypothetical protein
LLHSGTGMELEHVHPVETTPVVPSAAVALVTPQALLPDLIPWVDQNRGYLYGWIIQGNELRLETSVANVGAGRLELRGGAINSEGKQEVSQRIYEPDGTFTDVPAGFFTFHTAHDHIHFDAFVQFQLRAVTVGDGVGDVVAGGLKTTYCILDFVRYGTSGGSARYQGCGQIQGLSPGWSDYYDHGLPGQSIDITGISSGTYWLEQVVDPDHRLTEANEDNNVARIKINLQTGSTTSGDTFEPNNSFSAASGLPNPEDHTYAPLSIHAANNNDYYHVSATATGPLTVRIDFQNSQGDIELAVYNAAQTRLGISQTAGNSETVTINAVGGQLYYIRVWGYNGATNPNYSLTVDQPEAPAPLAPDAFEENDAFATAASLQAIDQVYNSLSVDTPGDDDYYSLVPPTSGWLATSLAFLNSQGNVQLEVYNAAQTRLGVSQTTGNSEQVTVPVTAGETYFIRVLGATGVTNPSYSMTVDLIDASSSTAYYLSTGENGTLSSTDGSANVSFTDADILKLSVFANGLRRYELAFDGSDVGLSSSSEDIDAFTILPDGKILVSTTGSFSVPASGGGTLSGVGQDLLLFTPTSLGATTAGTWSFYFDGSDVGLSNSSENIDAVARLSDGRLLISTTGSASVSGVSSGQDEDLLAFNPTQTGSTTAGSWSLYFDGSDVGLSNNNEDVNALFVRENLGLPTLYLSTLGSFSVSGVSGANEDVVAFNPTSVGSTTAGSYGPGLAFDGSLYGLGSFNVDGIHIGPAPAPFPAFAQALVASAANGPQVLLSSTPTVQLSRPSVKAKAAARSASVSVPSTLSALAVALQTSKAAKVGSTEAEESDCGCRARHAEPAAAAEAQSTSVQRLKVG